MATEHARLVRPGEATVSDRVSLAVDDNTFALLATDELRVKLTAYLESGELTVLMDIVELCQTLAGIQGVDPPTFLGMGAARIGVLGSYNGRLVLHPPDEPQE